jgi:hypothetical protein
LLFPANRSTDRHPDHIVYVKLDNLAIALRIRKPVKVFPRIKLSQNILLFERRQVMANLDIQNFSIKVNLLSALIKVFD